MLQSVGRITGEASEAVDLYTKQCSLNVSATDLAVMGATLANAGVNPLTKQAIVDAEVCHYTLAVRWTSSATASRVNWSHAFYRGNWGWTCSRLRRPQRPVRQRRSKHDTLGARNTRKAH
jgi:hypothetical protein